MPRKNVNQKKYSKILISLIELAKKRLWKLKIH